MAVEYLTVTVMNSPIADRLLTDGYRKSIDVEHYVERIGSLFVVILGEGVLLLVKKSPLGEGITNSTGTGVAALALYFILHMLYFRGNANAIAIHALKRSPWKLGLWQFAHLLLFSALLLLDNVNLFIVKHLTATADIDHDDTEEHARRLLFRRAEKDELTPEQQPHFMKMALGVGSIALATVMFALTCISLLNHTASQSKGHLIDNIYLRLAPRLILVAVLPCLPLIPHLTGAGWMSAAVSSVYLVIMWELITGFRKGGGFFEPKN